MALKAGSGCKLHGTGLTLRTGLMQAMSKKTRTDFMPGVRPKKPGSAQSTQKQRTPPGLPDGVQESAMTYFPSEKYHRQRRLNCCVRDGNRCFPLSMFTGKSVVGVPADDG